MFVMYIIDDLLFIAFQSIFDTILFLNTARLYTDTQRIIVICFRSAHEIFLFVIAPDSFLVYVAYSITRERK